MPEQLARAASHYYTMVTWAWAKFTLKPRVHTQTMSSRSNHEFTLKPRVHTQTTSSHSNHLKVQCTKLWCYAALKSCDVKLHWELSENLLFMPSAYLKQTLPPTCHSQPALSHDHQTHSIDLLESKLLCVLQMHSTLVILTPAFTPTLY